MQKNPVCFWELASHNAEATVDFLKKVFDWDIAFNKDIGFYTVSTGQNENAFFDGGVFTLRKAKLPFLTIYIKVEDIFTKAKLVEETGGHIVEQPFQIASGSYICLFNEPSGVTLAMIQPAKRK